MIEHLPLLTPNAARSDRTVARCREKLARRRRRVEAINRRPQTKTLLLESLLLGGFCVVYLVAAVGNVLAVYR